MRFNRGIAIVAFTRMMKKTRSTSKCMLLHGKGLFLLREKLNIKSALFQIYTPSLNFVIISAVLHQKLF